MEQKRVRKYSEVFQENITLFHVGYKCCLKGNRLVRAYRNIQWSVDTWSRWAIISDNHRLRRRQSVSTCC